MSVCVNKKRIIISIIRKIQYTYIFFDTSVALCSLRPRAACAATCIQYIYNRSQRSPWCVEPWTACTRPLYDHEFTVTSDSH